jgi:hypothetical protein
MRDPRDLDEHRSHVDSVARCRLFLAEHVLGARERERTLDALLSFLDGAVGYVRTQAEAGHTGHAAEWNAGYADKNRRAHRWIERNRAALVRPEV